MSHPLSVSEKSALFTSYNHLRRITDGTRVNRALGLAQSGEERPYDTTAESCTCPDWQYRGRRTGQPCKHMLSLVLCRAVDEMVAMEEELDLLNIARGGRQWFVELAGVGRVPVTAEVGQAMVDGAHREGAVARIHHWGAWTTWHLVRA